VIDRYALPEMRELFGERRRLKLWLRIELLAAEALHETCVIPGGDWQRLPSALSAEEEDVERDP
jgi:adenylosuccinate lyase